jgi:hypothetical protein
LTSDSNSIVVELTDDPAIITECRTSALRQGKCLVCRRCESNLSIAAIMILPIGGSIRLPLCAETAWASCQPDGRCHSVRAPEIVLTF